MLGWERSIEFFLHYEENKDLYLRRGPNRSEFEQQLALSDPHIATEANKMWLMSKRFMYDCIKLFVFEINMRFENICGAVSNSKFIDQATQT